LDLGQALTHPVTSALGMVESIEHSSLGALKVLGQGVKVAGSQEGWLRRPPPRLGEQTAEVLDELGYSRAQIDAFIAEGVVEQAAGVDGTT
jgi:crotonobetainyl-CoA:carnitine CoA-transferase CaiB-like acyl-CoA transferase